MKALGYISTRHAKPRGRQQGIALVITLGILTVILLLAMSFALSSRTEVKSGANFDALVSSKLVARAALDRCLMEMAHLNITTPVSGTSAGSYTSNDLTRVDGSYLNDSNQVLGAQGDFVNLDNDTYRSASEPYWISITNSTGQLIGRFAYAITSQAVVDTNMSSGAVDINAVGNIYSNSDRYARLGGYLGATNGGFTIGLCGDVSLISFLDMLGYSDPTNSARRILAYRYGWAGGAGNPPVNTYKPGTSADDNVDGMSNDPNEYNPANPSIFNRYISDVSQIQSLPIAADAASGNLSSYATVSSTDLNKYTPLGASRFNLNATKTGNLSHVSNLVVFLQGVFPTNNLNQLTQWAVNLIDFHTPDFWPTVYTGGIGGTNTFNGIKITPYLNQIRIEHKVELEQSGANARVKMTIKTGVEAWNPYTTTFSQDLVASVSNKVSLVFPSGAIVGGSPDLTSVEIASTVDPDFHKYQIVDLSPTWYSAYFPTSNLTGPVTFSNTVSYTFHNKTNSANLVNKGAFTPSRTNITLSTGMSAVYFYVNYEADDPRVNELFPQTGGASVGGSGYYGLGSRNNYNWAQYGGPTATNREGLASFHVKMTNYVSIGEVGYVHRGEQWKTLRLQPGGDGTLLELVRLNELTDIRGRININSDTNGVGGAPLESPSLFALFGGLKVTNLSASASQSITYDKITNIIWNLGSYRSSLSTGGAFTNVGQICELQSLITDNAGASIAATNDAAREAIVRGVANLITYRTENSSEVHAWGQAIKGNKVTGRVHIRAWYTKDTVSKRIKLTKFEYNQQ